MPFRRDTLRLEASGALVPEKFLNTLARWQAGLLLLPHPITASLESNRI